MPSPLSRADASELIRLCRAARVRGRSLDSRWPLSLVVSREVRTTPLDVALDTGFHSIVELLLRHEESQQAKNHVLSHALFMDKPAFVELAIAHGAEITSVPFLDILLTGDRALIASFLERGADLITDIRSLGPFTSCARRRRLSRIWTTGAADLTSQRACSGRWTWPCASSPMREI